MKEIALQAIIFAEQRGWDPMLTEVLRTPLENDLCYGGHGDHMTGVHVVGRGVDISIATVAPLLVDALLRNINDDWIYDPARSGMRCALLHQSRFDPGPPSRPAIVPHVHLQAYPSTLERTFGGERT